MTGGGNIETGKRGRILTEQMSGSPEVGDAQHCVIFSRKFFLLFATYVEASLAHGAAASVGQGSTQSRIRVKVAE